MQLDGKVAIVTGSSRGIGKAIALELAREGADIVVVARTETAGGPLPGTIHQTSEEIMALGRNALPVKVDITREEEVEAMVKQAMSQFGKIDILVNNAAVNIKGGTLMDVPMKRYDLLWTINVKGSIHCTRAVLPHMIARKQGTIVNVSSLASLAADPAYYKRTVKPTSIAYAMSKAAINVMTVCLAQEIGQHNITVNALLPFWTATEGVLYLMPNADPSKMQAPSMWGKYVVKLAAQSNITGQLFTEEGLREQFGAV